MKRKDSVQISLIILTILAIGGITFALFKLGVIERDPVQEDLPQDNVVEIDDGKEELIEVDEEELVENKADYDIEVGKLAPNFTLMNLEGKEVSLEDFRGKIVLINFWATWCGYCDKEMPDIQKLSEENDDLVVLAVNVMEKKEIVERYIEEGGYNFEVVLDEKGDIAIKYLAQYLPTSYFIDKDGILVGGKVGMLTGPEMNGAIENIRKGE